MVKRLSLRVVGRVQGVGFRNFVIGQALLLGVTGWVANTRDGAVEIVAEGSEEALQRLEERAKRGPAMAHVTDVRSDWSDATDEFHVFSQR